MEGTIEIEDAIERYLEPGTSKSASNRILQSVQDVIVKTCKRIGKHGSASLLKLPRERLWVKEQNSSSSSPLPPGTPTIDEFISINDPNGDFSYDEILESYKSQYGIDPNANASPRIRLVHRDQRLHKKRIELIRDLSRIVAQSPVAVDDVRGWFEENVANKFLRAGIQTVEQLAAFINQHGYWWHKHIRGLGPKSAKWIIDWLDRNEATTKIKMTEKAKMPLALVKTAETLNERRDTSVTVVGNALAQPMIFGPVVDGLFLPPMELDGSQGTNRAERSNNRLIENGRKIDSDREAILKWISIYDQPRHEHTRRNYLREAERLLLWCVIQKKKAFSSLDTSDITEYRKFLANPQPHDLWTANRNYQRRDPSWRPFLWREPPRALRFRSGVDVGLITGLSADSIRFSMAVVSKLLNFLVQMNYLDFNPMNGQPKASRSMEINAGRSLTQKQWKFMLETLDALDPADPKTARYRFLIHFAYSTGLRLSEMSSIQLGDFRMEELGDDMPSAMELYVVGKGQAQRTVPIPTSLQKELSQYLRSRGLPDHPALCPADEPLIGRVVTRITKSPEVSRSLLHKVFTDFFRLTAARMAEQDQNFSNEDYRRFLSASAHWMRHTHGSHAVAHGASLATIKENLGHKSLTTTSVYVKTEKRRRFEQMEAFDQASFAKDRPDENESHEST